MADIEVVESEEQPICPHCGKEISKILKKTKGAVDRHIIYFCSECKKVLSIGNDLYRG